MVSEMSLYSMQEDNYLDEDMDGVEKLSCGCYEEMCECPQCEICGERISPDLEECENVGEDWHNPEEWDSETFEAKEIMDCSLCGNNLSPIPKDYDGYSLGAYLNNDDDNHGRGSPFHAIGECNNCNLTYFSPPIEDTDGLISKVLCNNWAEEDGEGGFCAYPFDWNEMWEKRCEKCDPTRKGEIDRLNEHDCMDNSKVEIIEGDMIVIECEICKKTKQYVSNQKSFNVEFNDYPVGGYTDSKSAESAKDSDMMGKRWAVYHTTIPQEWLEANRRPSGGYPHHEPTLDISHQFYGDDRIAFDPQWYEQVATATFNEGHDGELLWRLTNNVDESWSRDFVLPNTFEWGEMKREKPLSIDENGKEWGLRSSMIGDIFHDLDNNEMWIVADFGFEKVHNPENKTFNVEFNEWADQEMNSHGKNISFKDWAEDEGMKHGNSEITDWAEHEDESHDARYGAEEYDHVATMRKLVAWLKENDLEPSDIKGFTPEGHVILKPKTQRANYKEQQKKINKDRKAKIKAWKKKNNYDLRKNLPRPVRQRMLKELFAAESLGKDSCCCGATKTHPCACMIQGIETCSATCPCSLEKKGAETYEDSWEKGVIRLAIGGGCFSDEYAEWVERQIDGPSSTLNNPRYKEIIDKRWGLNAENWGGDPEGKLALALQKARDKAKEPRKPLKIEKLEAETFEGIPKSVSDLESLEDVRADKYEMEVNFENEDIVIVSGAELKAIIDDGWYLDSVRSFADAGMSLLFTRNPYHKAETSGQWEIGEQLDAEIDGEELIASSANFGDGSMIVGVGTETLDVDNPDFMEMMIDKDGKIEYFTLPIGLDGWDRHYNVKPSHYGKMKTQNETNESTGGDFIRTDGDGKYAESFSAPTKGIDTFTKPFEESSLDSGTVKSVLVGLGIGALALFGYNKWK